MPPFSIFTPYNLHTNERLDLRLTQTDLERFGNIPRHGKGSNAPVELTDQVSGRKGLARRESCGLNCRCDASWEWL